MNGVVVKFDRKRGYGFLRVENVRRDYFVHLNQVEDGRALVVGQVVSFEPAEGDRGPEARRVIAGSRPVSPTLKFGTLGLVLAGLFTAGAWFTLPFVGLTLAWFLALSVATFLLFGFDKALARFHRNRVPERVLLGLAFLGGSPGALLAMRIFRHKTIKRSFRIGFWVVVGIQIAVVLLWWFSGSLASPSAG